MSDSDQGPSRLDRATQLAIQRLNQLEGRLRAYESRLDVLLQTTHGHVIEAVSVTERLDNTGTLLENALKNQLPDVERGLDEIDGVVKQLDQELPTKQASIDGMQTLYHSGRKRLRILEDELRWLTTPYIIQILKAAALFYTIPRSRVWIRNVRLGAYVAIAIFAFLIQKHLQEEDG